MTTPERVMIGVDPHKESVTIDSISIHGAAQENGSLRPRASTESPRVSCARIT